MAKDSKLQRLEEAINYLVSIGKMEGKDIVKELSDKVDRHPNNVRAALRGEERYLTSKFVKAFCLAFNGAISHDWILNGVGDMTSGPIPSYIDGNSDKTKPRIPTMAMAGYLSDYVDGVMRDDCEFLPIIQRFPSYDFTMFIKGNSMEPKYEGGDEIACKRVYDVIEWGKTYVLDTTDGAVVKRVYDAGDKIRCVSYNNEEYPDFFIEKENIRGFYKVVGLVRI